MNYDQILQNVEKHISLDAGETDYFISLLEPKVVKRKKFLLQAGEVCHFTNYVHKGCLRNYTIDDRGFVHISLFAIEDWWISDLHSFLTQTPATLYIDALEDTEVFQMSKANMEKLYIIIPKFERFFRIMHQNAFIAQQQRLMQNISDTAEDRYRQFKEKYPRLELRISQKQVAAYLGITPEFLSMIKRKMAKS